MYLSVNQDCLRQKNCSHSLCRQTPKGAECYCRPGYLLDSDGVSCTGTVKLVTSVDCSVMCFQIFLFLGIRAFDLGSGGELVTSDLVQVAQRPDSFICWVNCCPVDTIYSSQCILSRSD